MKMSVVENFKGDSNGQARAQSIAGPGVPPLEQSPQCLYG